MKKLFLVSSILFTSACGDDYPILYTTDSTNNTDDPVFQQMYAAFSQKPRGLKTLEYGYVYVNKDPHEAEDNELRRRSFYLYEALTRPEKKVVSLGCKELVFCMKTLNRALDLIIDSGRRENRILMLPEYLDPPYKKADEAGMSIILYKIPSFEMGDSD